MTAEAIDRAEAATTVVAAIMKANRDYETWSRGDWLSDCASEGLMHAVVAKVLHRKGWGPVALEAPISWLKTGVKQGEGRRGRLPKGLRAHGRCDVVILEPAGSYEVAVMVELKRLQAMTGWQSDLERLAESVGRYGCAASSRLQFGMLAGLTVASTSSGLERLHDALAAEVGSWNEHWRDRRVTLELHGLAQAKAMHTEGYPEYASWRHSAFAVTVAPARTA